MKGYSNNLITTILPVITLIIGLCVGPIISWISFMIKNQMRYKYILQLMRFVVGQIDRQIINISNIVENLNNKEKTDYLIRPISGNYLARLNRINDIDFYNAFIQRKAFKKDFDLVLFTAVVKSVDYFSDCIPHILDANQMMISEINELILNWHTIHKRMIVTFNDYKTEYLKNHDSIINDKLLLPIDNILKDTKKVVEQLGVPEIALNEIVTPINVICKNQPADNRANIIFHLTQESTYILNAYLNVKKSHSDYLKKVLEELESSNSRFKEELDKILPKNLKGL